MWLFAHRARGRCWGEFEQLSHFGDEDKRSVNGKHQHGATATFSPSWQTRSPFRWRNLRTRDRSRCLRSAGPGARRLGGVGRMDAFFTEVSNGQYVTVIELNINARLSLSRRDAVHICTDAQPRLYGVRCFYGFSFDSQRVWLQQVLLCFRRLEPSSPFLTEVTRNRPVP